MPALSGYDPRITKSVNQLVAVVDQNEGQPLDVSKWFACFSFDVMEDLAFNDSSNMLAEGKGGRIFQTIRNDMFALALFSHLPWLATFPKRIPLINKNYLEFWAWLQNKIDERRQVRRDTHTPYAHHPELH